jgi:hypothetical protein
MYFICHMIGLPLLYVVIGLFSSVPHSNLFIIVNPICLMVDYITIEWLNAFMIDLANKAVQNLGNKNDQSKVCLQ